VQSQKANSDISVPTSKLPLVSGITLATLFLGLCARAQTPASKLGGELQSKREALAGWHQEFEVTQSYKTSHGTQESRRDIIIDVSQGRWRQRSISGSGDTIRIFDGQDLSLMESDGEEFVRIKRKEKDVPRPQPYSTDWDWAKAKELERRPCGLTGTDHTCIILEVPVKATARLGTNGEIAKTTDGVSRMAVDSETGLLLQCVSQEVIDNGQTAYNAQVTYTVTKMRYGVAPEVNLFKLPENTHEVKELSRWNSARIKKALAGKQAPELGVTDIEGRPVSISSMKGKTVLLDFWATWCPPCLADAPALDKLYAKYGGKDLMIVGISVSENRDVVEKFLKKHPHNYPIVLTSENEMPRPYQIGVFPTYMIIAPDGTLTNAVEGDQGFSDLRKDLEKAGMATD
jgi:thiol-disulfide isomerase/thioredoxin